MNLRSTQQKLSATEAFCHTVDYLISSSRHLAPILPRQGVGNQEDNHIFWTSIAAHMLCSIVVENSIKVLWEVENKTECGHTHNILKLYSHLYKTTQQRISELYDDVVLRFSKIEGTFKGKVINLSDVVKFASLEQALKSNEMTMKNFKYDNKFEGKTSVMGNAVWNQETIWVFPAGQEAFATVLFRYVKERCV